jgi:hypothetical protein
MRIPHPIFCLDVWDAWKKHGQAAPWPSASDVKLCPISAVGCTVVVWVPFVASGTPPYTVHRVCWHPHFYWQNHHLWLPTLISHGVWIFRCFISSISLFFAWWCPYKNHVKNPWSTDLLCGSDLQVLRFNAWVRGRISYLDQRTAYDTAEELCNQKQGLKKHIQMSIC